MAVQIYHHTHQENIFPLNLSWLSSWPTPAKLRGRRPVKGLRLLILPYAFLLPGIICRKCSCRTYLSSMKPFPGSASVCRKYFAAHKGFAGNGPLTENTRISTQSFCWAGMEVEHVPDIVRFLERGRQSRRAVMEQADILTTLPSEQDLLQTPCRGNVWSRVGAGGQTEPFGNCVCQTVHFHKG